MKSNPFNHSLYNQTGFRARKAATCLAQTGIIVETMAKAQRMHSLIKSFGIYEAWDGDQKHVPKIKEFTLEIPARIGIEFGYILNIKHARGIELRFEIDHPPWINDDGQQEAPFTGTFYVRHNEYDFFLGDTIWEPWEQKLGPWTLRTWHEDKLLAEKTFMLIDPDLLNAI